jgi:hypothetical protein
MYTFSSKLKTFSFVLMLVGVLGIGYGFFTAPKTIQDVENILAADAHHDHSSTDDAHTTHANDAKAQAEHQEHLEHVLHQLQNKPWAAVYVACIFFMLISLGALVFYAIQQVAQAGWSPVLFRVMQGISAYLLPGSIIFFILLLLSGLHFNHLFVWMKEGLTEVGHENYDKLVAGKSGYLNVPFWLIRAATVIILVKIVYLKMKLQIISITRKTLKCLLHF